jgi:hypothetical protein
MILPCEPFELSPLARAYLVAILEAQNRRPVDPLTDAQIVAIAVERGLAEMLFRAVAAMPTG